MNGILVIDKPKGLTSHDIVARIRRIINFPSPLTGEGQGEGGSSPSPLNPPPLKGGGEQGKKAGIIRVGHGGTLDPLATGVLPILIGTATKLSSEVMQGDKEYIAEIKLGEETDTDDSKGKVTNTGPVPKDIEAGLKDVLPRFLGRLMQVPPAYSAIKKGGRKAYNAARKGQTLELEPRAVEVRELELLRVDSPVFTVRVKCSKGTYIRALARDIGREMGIFGHVTGLRRTVCGAFKIGEAIDLNKISTGQEIAAVLRTPEL